MSDEQVQLSISTIRTLSIDAVQQATSGQWNVLRGSAASSNRIHRCYRNAVYSDGSQNPLDVISAARLEWKRSTE